MKKALIAVLALIAAVAVATVVYNRTLSPSARLSGTWLSERTGQETVMIRRDGSGFLLEEGKRFPILWSAEGESLKLRTSTGFEILSASYRIDGDKLTLRSPVGVLGQSPDDTLHRVP